MLTLTTIAAVHRELAAWRAQAQDIALVPTMGKLHAGHLALVEAAKQRAARVVVSIYVNPLQFSKGEDFTDYPRTIEEDSVKLTAIGADLLFLPGDAEMYPGPVEHSTWVEVPGLSGILCGAHRPGHFRGVATVVNKLFNIVQPRVAVFGEKDYQQLQVIRCMAVELAMPVEIVGMPTVREADGLALSSRNSYLSADERRRAPALYQALCTAKEQIVRGERNFAGVEAAAIEALQQGGFRPDYFQVCRADKLSRAGAEDVDLVILTAAWLGKTRLIDNLPLRLKTAP
ncbi:MAG: pantoate--beta-alanine ligase [Gammaproteobacteria bacterium]